VADIHFLLVREPIGAERTIPLGTNEVVFLGRDDDCTIQLESPYVSRRHARIAVGHDAAVFADLGSHNGSMVNGKRVEADTTLKPGDTIAIGDVTIECIPGTPRTVKTRTLVRPSVSPPSEDMPPNLPGHTLTLDVPEVPLTECLRLDARTMRVWIDDQPLQKRLSAQEFKLLSYLHEHRDRICTRQELGNAIWGRYTWDPNLLYRLVRRLKEKIEPDPKQPRFLQTVPWVGYRLIL
jgi:hypothetical protein